MGWQWNDGKDFNYGVPRPAPDGVAVDSVMEYVNSYPEYNFLSYTQMNRLSASFDSSPATLEIESLSITPDQDTYGVYTKQDNAFNFMPVYQKGDYKIYYRALI